MGTSLGADVAQTTAAKFEALALEAALNPSFPERIDATLVALLFHDGGYCATVVHLTGPATLVALLGYEGIDPFSVLSENPPWALAYEDADGKLVVMGKGGLNVHLRELYWGIIASGEQRIDYGRQLSSDPR